MKNINEAKAVPTRLTNEGIKSICDAVKAGDKSDAMQSKAVDQLTADGVRWTDFISPTGKSGESTATPELYDALKNAIVSGFIVTKRKLLASPTKSLDEQGKVDKRKHQQSIGAYMGAFKRDLQNRQEPKPKAERAPQPPKTGDKVVDEARSNAHKANKKVTDLQNWFVNNLPENISTETHKLLTEVLTVVNKINH